MSSLLREWKQAVRTLAKARGFSAVVVLTLALGIGVTTAVFTIFHSVLLTPLPYPDPDELVLVYDTQPACNTCPASFPKYHDWRERNRVFAAIGGSTQASYVLTGNGELARIQGAATTASLVDVFGVQPRVGRWYNEQEDQAGGQKVVVLSHGFWKRRLNSDPGVVGKKLLFDGTPYEVIGVMPEGFSHRRAEFFVPLQRKLDPTTRGSHFLATYARLKKGVTLAQATADMRALGQSLASEFQHNHGIDVASYFEAIVGGVRTPLKVLLGAVFCLLLIACANVANLLLASGLARQRELAIRMTMGAGPGALARQLATESVVLSLTGGAVGVLLAYWIVSAFTALATGQLPRAATIGIDGRVLAFTAGISVVVGLICSLWPILVLCRQDLASAVREGDVRSGVGAGKRIGNQLVVTEVALAFALLIGAGVLIKDLILLKNRDTGMRTERIISFEVAPSGTRYQADESVVAFYRELHARLSQVNGVESLGMTSHLPMYNFGWNGEFQIEGGAPWGPNDAPLVEYRWMYGEYLKTLGVPLLNGRMLEARDGKNTNTVLINRAMAEKFWPGKDPIGRRFGQGQDVSKWYEVVGVIGNIRSYGLARTVPYEFYRNIEQSAFSSMTVVLRTRNEDSSTMIPIARQMVNAIDPSLPITDVQTLEQVVADSVGQPRLMSALTGLFGGLAGLLAMVGVYSVMAYNVRRQRREYGVRMALGAEPSNVSRLVIRRGLTLAVIGVVIGGIGAWLLTGVLKTMVHDGRPKDWTVFAATAGLVLLVALLASYLPAWSASRVDPMVVLRDS